MKQDETKMSSMKKPCQRGGKWPVLVVLLAIILLIISVVLVAGVGPAYQMEWVTLGTAFMVLRQGAYLAVAAGLLGLLVMVVAGFCRRWRLALLAGLVSLAVAEMLVLPVQMMQRAESVPKIHDISTDLVNPPAFVALAAAREAAPNAVDYPGEDTARQQRLAYPEIKPITLDMTLTGALTRVRGKVQELGWEIAAVTENSIEATATTRWFGFKDDVVIRLREVDQGVQIDMRSASRVGKSDVGTNAARIEAFLAALKHHEEFQ
jgi:uncharacterized protein (DUF1499 family)